MQIQCVAANMDRGDSGRDVVPCEEGMTSAIGSQGECLEIGAGLADAAIGSIARNFLDEICAVPNPRVNIEGDIDLELTRVIDPGQIEFAAISRQSRLHGDASAV